MGLGPYIYLLWSALVLASLIVAGIHLARRQRHGIQHALGGVIGALSTWAFVSAYAGACEMTDYVGSMAFAISIGVGIAGITLFILGCSALKSRPRETDSSNL
jgi:hypothetical protein